MKFVKAAPGSTPLDPAPVLRGKTRFCHMPCTENQLGRPSPVSEGFHERVLRDRQGLSGALGHASKTLFATGRTQTSLGMGRRHNVLPGPDLVDTPRADLRAGPTSDAALGPFNAKAREAVSEPGGNLLDFSLYWAHAAPL